MVNKHYLKGVRLERAIVNAARKRGLIAFRSAGSHSNVDCVIIDTKNKKVWFVQCKAGKAIKSITKVAQKEFVDYSDEYLCKFIFISSTKEMGGQ